ncbi:MAG: HAD-IIA family hydrolase [Spirochaetaceae bacterium]
MIQNIDDNKINKVISCVIFDLDGTIYRGDKVIPGAAHFVKGLQDKGILVMFYTNRAYRTPTQIADKLKSMNFPIKEDQVYTSAIVTANALRGRRVFCIGEPALTEALISEGAIITENNPDDVVLGYVDTLEMNTMSKAVQFISHEQARFVATNLDPYILVDGKRVPENGAIAAAIQIATGQLPVVYGKPEPFGINMILKKYNLEAEEVLIVGDTLATDIQCGVNAGIRTALILTGVSSALEACASEAEIIVDNYNDLRIKIFGS